jgi:hypothetical protein
MALSGALLGAFFSVFCLSGIFQVTGIPSAGAETIRNRTEAWLICGATVGAIYGAIRGWLGKKKKWPHTRLSKQ